MKASSIRFSIENLPLRLGFFLLCSGPARAGWTVDVGQYVSRINTRSCISQAFEVDRTVWFQWKGLALHPD